MSVFITPSDKTQTVNANRSNNRNQNVNANGSNNRNQNVNANGSNNRNQNVNVKEPVRVSVHKSKKNVNSQEPGQAFVKDPIINSILNAVLTIEKLELLINHELIRNNYYYYIESLESNKKEQNEAIQLYQVITSDNFISLLWTIGDVISPQVILFRSSIFTEKNNPYLGYIIFKKIYELVVNFIRDNHFEKNTSFELLTDKNVSITEDFDTLHLRDINSLYHIFGDFSYFNKNSASTSLVFTAKLKELGNNNVKKKVTLLPDKLFYFKAFPVGSVLNISRKKINYPTEGLQTELNMYSELFKLEKYNITPNILCKLTLMQNITGFEQFLKDTHMLELAKKHTFESVNPGMNIPNKTIWDKVSIISTHPGGPDIYNIFKTLTPIERKEVMFQIIYNLYVFDQLEISQGDLHSKNLKINILPEMIELCYIVKQKKYVFKTKHLVKFYDLDCGMIGKTTTLKFDYDGNEESTINKIVNPDRSSHMWRNTTYGMSDIYNPNLDIVKLFMNSSVGLRTVLPNNDPEFNNFLQTALPGIFNSINRKEYIIDTYKSLLEIPYYQQESNKIFGITNMNIDRNILNSTWIDYFINCGNLKTGYIVKSFERTIPNNQLWIPDTIIFSKENMLQQSYFNNFYKKEPYHIDITKQIVYTFDRVTKFKLHSEL